MKRLLGALAVVATLLGAQPASAATYYVAATGGSDSRSCSTAQTLSTPKLTITSGLTCLSAGDTLFVRAGTYDETLFRNIPSGTSWAASVRVANYSGETVWLAPSSGLNSQVIAFGNSQHYIDIDGINLDATLLSDSNVVTIDAGVSGHDAHHIRIQNAEIKGSQSIVDSGAKVQGILSNNNDGTAVGGNEFQRLVIHDIGHNDFSHAFYLQEPNVLVEGCNIYNFGGAAVHLYNGYGNTFTGAVVRSNYIHANQSNGAGQRHWGILAADGATGALIYNNVVFSLTDEISGSGTYGILVYSANSVVIENNTVYSASNGVYVGSVSGTIVKNTISYGNNSNYTDTGSGTTHTTNLDTGTNPLFVNAGAGDFRLSTGSPAIDTGATLTNIPATDAFGTSRPQGSAWDMGAYEFVAATTTGCPNKGLFLLGVGCSG